MHEKQVDPKDRREGSFGVPLWVYAIIVIPPSYNSLRILTREAFDWSWSAISPFWLALSSVALVWLALKITQDNWKKDGGWSPRTLGVFLGVLLAVAYSAFWFWFWLSR